MADYSPIATLAVEYAPGMLRFCLGIRRRGNAALVIGDLANNIPDSALPAQLRPASAQFDTLADDLGRVVDMFRGVQKSRIGTKSAK